MGLRKRFSGELEAGADSGPIIIAALSTAEVFAGTTRLSERTKARLAVVVEELVSNAVRHGSNGNALNLSLTMQARPDEVAIAFEDDGVPFDPTQTRAFSGPDRDSGGGVGLALVQAWCGSLTYERVDGRNRLNLTLRHVA